MENKNINSIFEEPESFIYRLIIGISSFSVMLFVFVEHGFKIFGINQSDISFYIFLFLYLGLPAFLPFYNLILSGRNLPKHYLFFAFPPLFFIAFILIPFNDNIWIFVGLLSLWVVFFILMFSKGKSLRSTEDKQVFIKENTIIELSLLIAALSFGVILAINKIVDSTQVGVADAKKAKIKNDSLNTAFIKETFEVYSEGATTSKLIDNKRDSLSFLKEIREEDSLSLQKYLTLTDSSKKPTVYEPITILLKKYITTDTIKTITNFDSFISKKSFEIWKTQIQMRNNEEVFASNFEKVLKSYQQKGVILLLISAIMLLFLWVNTVVKEEISNRIKTHFFIILALIVPLFRSYDKKDITIDKPFGFSFTNGNESPKKGDINNNNSNNNGGPNNNGNPPNGNNSPKYVIISQDQLDQLAKESSVEKLKNEIPKTTYNSLAEIFNNNSTQTMIHQLSNDASTSAIKIPTKK